MKRLMFINIILLTTLFLGTDVKSENLNTDSSKTTAVVTVKNGEDIVPNPNERIDFKIPSLNCRGQPVFPQTNVTDSPVIIFLGLSLIVGLIVFSFKRKKEENE